MKKMMIINLLLFTFIFTGCKKEVYLQETSRLENETFNSGLRIEGHEFDGLVIDNCTFKNHALSIGSAENIIIKNCTFEDMSDHGILLGFIGACSTITIENCTFKNIGLNGIDCVEDTPDCIINGCRFENVALSGIGGAMGQYNHAIYWKGENVRITNNHFIAGNGEQADAISVRSSGVISGNFVEGHRINGITYFSDHPGGDSLFIENNIIVNNGRSITLSTYDDGRFNNKNLIVRFNTMIQENNYSVYIDAPFEATTKVSIYGNIIINPTGEYFRHFFKGNGPEIFSNLESATGIGFVDPTNNDFHILSSSIANGFCSGLANFPATDIDGDLRIQTKLDAGADENN